MISKIIFMGLVIKIKTYPGDVFLEVNLLVIWNDYF